jgi:hypothetical protein
MEPTAARPNTALAPLATAWLALVALTLLSLGLGHWFHGAAWLQVLVAAIVWIKGSLVARRFIEAELAPPFIRNVLRGFIAFTPIALLLTAFYGQQLARWATL